MTDSPDPGFAGSSETTEPLEATYRFPWPPAADAPVTAALVETWREATLHPRPFFEAMPQRASLGPPVLYYLVIGIVTAAIGLLWAILLPEQGAQLGEQFGDMPEGSPLVDFLLSPALLLLSLFVAGGVTHLMVLALVPQNQGFQATLRVFCFAYSPALLAAVLGFLPSLSMVLGIAWMTALSVVGIREVHRTSTGRALTAVLIPLVIATLFMALSYLLLKSGALLLAR